MCLVISNERLWTLLLVEANPNVRAVHGGAETPIPCVGSDHHSNIRSALLDSLTVSELPPRCGEQDMGYVTRWLATLCFAVALAVPGHAQLTGYYPFGTDSLSLSNDDFMRLIDAANGLLQRSPLPVGATANWQNNQTGSSGTIRVTKTFLHGSMRCHRLVYETTPAGTPPANRTSLDWCNTGPGEWKILPS